MTVPVCLGSQRPTMSDDSEATGKQKWYSIREAAEYLDVGEPTIYRWMREGKMTYRKVGDSTRFWKQDLDGVMQVFPSELEAEKVQEFCPVCHHPELVEGHVRSTGLNYFRPKKTKFWTFKDANVETRARMCTRCGVILWFGDSAKVRSLRQTKRTAGEETGEPGT